METLATFFLIWAFSKTIHLNPSRKFPAILWMVMITSILLSMIASI
jgi:hypothetical protein